MIAALAASIPSPSQGVWHLGPFPIRAYAWCIIVGIVVAVAVGGRRWEAMGNRRDDVLDVAMTAVPFGIIGGRLYHVLTDWSFYFGGHGRGLLAALRIWDGGLGIWGAISLGFLGGWIGARRRNLNVRLFADAVAPGIVLAQAIGRLGNWFNQELFGKPTDLPWGLAIDPTHRPAGYAQFETFQPTFLYELTACLVIAYVLMRRGPERRPGQTFALYVALYCAARFGIEWLRIDDAQHFLGLRLNEYTALLVGSGAVFAYRGLGRR